MDSGFKSNDMTFLKRNSTYIVMACAVMMQLFLGSCIPDPLEVKGIPNVKPQIVVNTQRAADGSLVVMLTRTFGALEASEDSDPVELINQVAITDAMVIIESPAREDTLTSLGSGFYGGADIIPEEGATYRLYVKSELLGEVTATTVVMQAIPFETIEVFREFSGDDTLAAVTYSIKDPPGKNYYVINVQRFSSKDPIEEQILDPSIYTRLVIDEEFPYDVSESFNALPRDYAAGDTVAVFLSNVSESYYEFLKMREDNRFGFLEFVSEPINYPSNVTGGRGFFNLHTTDVRLFVLR